MPEKVSEEFLDLQAAIAGRYSIEKELGRGGMGIVLLARDVKLDRLVAIKLLPKSLASQPELRKRFLKEARTAAGLSHPNIVPIHLVEEHDSVAFFVMAYIDGETLKERVKRAGPLTPRVAMKLLQEISWALAYAHQRGVVHRDVKPDNILIEHYTGRALIADFGIALVTAGQGSDSESEVFGSARYMSPEQVSGEAVDGRSDLYSLGASAFFAVSGRAPFEAANVPALLAKHLTQPPPSIVALVPDIPPRLAFSIDRCLEKSPENRYKSGDELAKAIGDARGRELRSPPIVRNFLRNAEISSAIVFAMAIFSGVEPDALSGLHILTLLLGGQLIFAARSVLRAGYTFDDIRAALLAEAEVQEEEAEAVRRGKWLRRYNGAWNRIWASGLGRFFFRMAGFRLNPSSITPLPSNDPTEVVLGRATTQLFAELPAEIQEKFPELPSLVQRLERDAELLRKLDQSDEDLTEAVAAVENLRIGILRLLAETGTVDDLTTNLQKAQEIGDRIDEYLLARGDVDRLLE